MRKVLYFVLSSAIVGCQSTSMLSKGSSPVEIIIVSPNKGNVRITYLEHNLLNTIYVEGDSCRYNIGPSTLNTIEGKVLLSPNSQC